MDGGEFQSGEEADKRHQIDHRSVERVTKCSSGRWGSQSASKSQALHRYSKGNFRSYTCWRCQGKSGIYFFIQLLSMFHGENNNMSVSIGYVSSDKDSEERIEFFWLGFHTVFKFFFANRYEKKKNYQSLCDFFCFLDGTCSSEREQKRKRWLR